MAKSEIKQYEKKTSNEFVQDCIKVICFTLTACQMAGKSSLEEKDSSQSLNF